MPKRTPDAAPSCINCGCVTPDCCDGETCCYGAGAEIRDVLAQIVASFDACWPQGGGRGAPPFGLWVAVEAARDLVSGAPHE